ncbi:family 92 glycosyl hydrolase [Truncatella angustata]|uniref:Family 92 glycosyl hydrolase n=1 Tax=Truncatella angustata TaxID=152316 RepID=A0A9P8RQF5_9PEZI|nr:family 92 glycosyl hydrolase [Truncatella angustata]KAH6647517.1 family 92 glycosyl hydrolase [Truncatella angustata]
MAPLLTSVPRLKRVLVLGLCILTFWLLLPSDGIRSSGSLVSLFVGARMSTGADVLAYIDPLIGTVNGAGHVFPGATLPYGMAKAVADVNSQWEAAAGFVSDNSLITGFSHLHDSGTGGSPSLGNFPLFVHPGCPGDEFAQCEFSKSARATKRVNGSVEARPGYFALGLGNLIHAEMTATKHTTLYHFTVPNVSEVHLRTDAVPVKPLVLIDLSDLAGNGFGGSVEVDPESGRITGNGTFNPSFGRGQYNAHFCADFRGAAIRKTGTFHGVLANETAKALGEGVTGSPRLSGSAGAWIHFDRPIKDRILARVGLSFISVDQACRNAENEIPLFEFNKTVQAAEKAWADKMSVIEVDHYGVSDDLLKTFWSGLYRALLSPQDYTGENQLWNSSEPYFDSFYCIWDSFRAQHPLLSIVDPDEQTRMVRALLDIYKHEGYLPDCRMSFSQGYTQGGSNADVVLADAFVKNLTAGIDWNLAYEAVTKDAEVEPSDWTSVGRGNIEAWKSYGYVPQDDVDKNGTGPMSRSISRTVEYAYDDFAIYLMAKGLGKAADEQKYRERSMGWKSLYNPDQEDRYVEKDGTIVESPFRGFLQPRLTNGTFMVQNPRLCSPAYEQHVCYFDTRYDTYEGSPWLYTFFVPQDMASLIQTLGGRKSFINRLEYFHSSDIVYMGNEQSFLPTFQFHYGGRPGLSSYWVHRYIPAQFNSSINGIPGNDDCAMGAFTAFVFMGFFPVAGQSVYLVTPPLFREVRIRTPTGKQAIIRNLGFDPTYQSIYIQSAKLNGKPYTKNWITHDFFYHGGVLELTLGKEESIWGTADEDLPPSLSTS